MSDSPELPHAETEEVSAPKYPARGDVIADRYEVEGVLGAGGMGVVLRARHTTLGQLVAIKLLLPELVKQGNAPERFLREARSATQLKSEHVARVTDVGTLDSGAPFMVMEHLEGEDLEALKRRGELPVRDVVDYVLQALEALGEAHSLGIVHRDLKPANLFLTRRVDGSPWIKVLDFGISKALGTGGRGITHTQAIMGSPGYMSPEQIRSSKHVDQRTDIWAMGVVLYELLTRQPAFDGDNVATLSAQVVTETPERVDVLRPEVPAGLGDVVARCLEKEPEQRYASVAELARALVPFGSPETALLAARIERIVETSPFAPTISEHDLRVEAPATGNAWSGSKPAAGKRRTVLLGVAATALIATTLVLVFALGRETGKLDLEQPRSSGGPDVAAVPALERQASAPAAPGAVPSEAPLAVSASAAVATPPLADAAAETKPPAAKAPERQPVRRAATAAPRCPAGQALSKGHCCPKGLVWMGSRCDRPLATSLP